MLIAPVLLISALVLTLTACSDDSEPVTQPDGGAPDTRADVTLDISRDTATPDLPSIDSNQDIGGDAEQADLIPSDSSFDRLFARDGSFTNACLQAPLLSLDGGRLLLEGDTSTFADDLMGAACKATSGGGLDGPQAYVAFEAEAGSWYKLVLSPSFDAYFFVFTSISCAASEIERDCQSGGVSGIGSRSVPKGKRQALYFKAPHSGPVTVGVDSIASWFNGSFTLEIEEFTPAGNTTCASAAPLPLIAGAALTRGDTAPNLSPDEYPTLSCDGTALSGPQVYYRFAAEAGKTYAISLTADTSQYLDAYVANATCDAAAISAACSSEGVSGAYVASSVGPGGVGTISYTASQDGELLIGVDSSQDFNYGGFTLRVEEQ